MCCASIFLREMSVGRRMWVLYSVVTKSQFQRKLNLFFFFLVSSYSYHIFNICPSLFLTSPTPSKTHRFSQYQQVLVFFLWHLSDSSASHHSSTTSLFYAAVISCLGCATSSFLGPMFFCLCPFNLLSSKVNKLSENITWPYHSSA